MSALELAIEKVRQLPEEKALALLDWLREQEKSAGSHANQDGASTVIGFARRYRNQPRRTQEWILQLRAGE
jgi:hypothetical protein